MRGSARGGAGYVGADTRSRTANALIAIWVKALAALAATSGGSLGAAILIVAVTVRVALLPLTVTAANRARDRARKLKAVKPELDALAKRYAGDPVALQRETTALYRRENIALLDGRALLAAAVQLPLFGSLYGAIRRVATSGQRSL